MRVLLTSAGLETQRLKECFIELLNIDMDNVKALFIPVAAINPDAISVLPKCMNDLLKCGIKNWNITVYDLHEGMDLKELEQFNLIYLCGGDAEYLLKRVNATGFNKSLKEFIHRDGVVFGVSAGSLIFANNLPNSLGLIRAKLSVHCTSGDKSGKYKIPLKDNIKLTNSSALIIYDYDYFEIIN